MSNLIRRILALLAFALGLMAMTPVYGGEFEDAMALYASGDSAGAAKLFRSLADQGHAIAQANLGVMYIKGTGVPQDYTEAAKWMTLAAQQGLTDAQYNLGIMYAEGRGVPQDDVVAVNWFRRSVEQGYALALNSLGIVYERGEGVTQDYVQSYKWFYLAAAQGVEQARDHLNRVAKSMTTGQITEAQRLAREWKAKP